MRATYRLSVMILIVGCLGSMSALAEVFKWTDEQGRIHYSDKAPDENAQTVRIRPKQETTTSSAEKARRKENTRRLLRAFEEERRIEQAQQYEQQVQEAKRVKRCAAARDRLKEYRDSRALYNYDEQGNRYFLSEEKRKEVEDGAAREVQRWCD